jgi:hypothetical protein
MSGNLDGFNAANVEPQQAFTPIPAGDYQVIILAKNRLRMPPEIEFSWAAYASYFAKPSGNIDGTVVDGSSKTEAE